MAGDLHPGPHNFPGHLLCQVGRYSPKLSTGWSWKSKSCFWHSVLHPDLPSLPSASPPTTTWGHLSLQIQGAHPVQCSARGTQGFEAPVCPSQWHHRVIPSWVGGAPSWDRNAQDQVAPLVPLVLEIQQSSLFQGKKTMCPKRCPHKEGTIHLPLPSLAPTMLLTALPQWGPHHPARHPGLVAVPAQPAPPGCPGGGSRVQKQLPHAKELGPSRHALLKPHQPSY